jgi:hypothetical protein
MNMQGSKQRTIALGKRRTVGLCAFGSPLERALRERVDALVDAGELTREQGDDLRATIAAGPGSHPLRQAS